jgi:GNAT superfamily N-acetyltransferase
MQFSGPEAERLADAIEATACRDLYAAAESGLRMRASGIAGSTVLIAPTLPVPYFNRVIGLGNDAAAREDDIEQVMAAYSSAAVSTYWIHRIPSAQPPNLASLLEHRGFTPAPRGSWAKFLRNVEDAPAIRTDLRLREATPADAMPVAHVLTSAYGMPAPVGPWFGALIGRPGWQVWVAELGGRIVATGALFVQGDIGWVGAGATLAEYRGRGAQRALLSARIDAAAARGCSVLGTETGEPIAAEPSPSYANIVRAGFTRVCSRMNYALSAQT